VIAGVVSYVLLCCGRGGGAGGVNKHHNLAIYS